MSNPIPNCPQPETPIRERAYAPGQAQPASEYTHQQVIDMATNVRDCAWPADVKEYMVLIEPMLRAYAATLRQQGGRAGWLPIATAPRDGTRVLAYAEREGYEPVTISCYVLDARGQNGVWAMAGPRVIPTLWQPLPGNPAQRVCPALIDADTDASEANAQYGESYGVDWMYEPKQAERGDVAVSDEVVERACAIYFGGQHWPHGVEEIELVRISMRAVVEAVAPLLRAPAEHGGKVDGFDAWWGRRLNDDGQSLAGLAYDAWQAALAQNRGSDTALAEQVLTSLVKAGAISIDGAFYGDAWKIIAHAKVQNTQDEPVGEVFGPKALSTMVALTAPLSPGTKLYTHADRTDDAIYNEWEWAVRERDALLQEKAERARVPEDTLDRLLVGKATDGDQLLAYNALASATAAEPDSKPSAAQAALLKAALNVSGRLLRWRTEGMAPTYREFMDLEESLDAAIAMLTAAPSQPEDAA